MVRNTPRATPGRLLLLFALLMVAVTAATWRDARQRSELEEVTFPTALGDAEFCPSELLAPGQSFQAWLSPAKTDQVWTAAGDGAVEGEEDRFVKTGRDSADRFYIYQPSKGAAVQSYFVKTGDGMFREIKPQSN